MPGEERGLRTVNAAEADIVRRIFREYVADQSPLAIVTALNKEGIPSPRGGKWNASTLNGNRQRAGILSNSLYVGRLKFERQKFVKDPKTGKRQARRNAQSEWVEHDFPELRSVAVFLPQRLGELGVEAPILVSVYIMAWPATQSLVGLAYARLRARASYLTLLQLSMLACVAAFLILGTVDQPLALSAATAFLGAGTGVVFSALSVLIADLVPEALLGRATAMSSTALFVGQFISPLALGPLMAATSITTGYIVVAGLAALILAILVIIGSRSGPCVKGAGQAS